jgi:hypothetical protein
MPRRYSSEVVHKLTSVGRKKPELQHNAEKLAFEQFSELNAMLYRTNPSEYFQTRLHSVAVHANKDAEPVTLPSGAILWLPVSDVDTRASANKVLRIIVARCFAARKVTGIMNCSPSWGVTRIPIAGLAGYSGLASTSNSKLSAWTA